jgi:hypothetical protein
LFEDESPIIRTTCFVSRLSHFYAWNAYFLIFLITITSLSTFSIDHSLPHSRLQSAYTLLLTSISFKWVINRSLPTISYFTSLDFYSTSNTVYICFVAAWHAIVAKLWNKNEAKSIDEWALLGFLVFFLLIQILLLIKLMIPSLAIHRLKQKEKIFLEKIYCHPILKKRFSEI